jgi:hypothetical protein
MRTLTADQLESMIIDAMRADDWTTVAQLEARLDAIPAKPATAVVSAALWYASVGLRVFPLQPLSKIPHKGTRGCKDATTNPEQIIAWWRRWPDSNVAIATGHLVDVIDIDGPVGVHSWAHIEHLPPVLGIVSTPRAGGSHLYVAAAGDGNAAGVWPGIDLRGRGGYVVAPPSINNDGIAYRWRVPLQLSANEAAT